MSVLAPLERHACDECGEVYDDEIEAQDCWAAHFSGTKAVPVFRCPVCHEDHETRDMANACIDDHEAAGERLMPTAAELEAAGQQRLFL